MSLPSKKPRVSLDEPVWLGLASVPRDVRKLLYQKLTLVDKHMTRIAHGLSHENMCVSCLMGCAGAGYLSLLKHVWPRCTKVSHLVCADMCEEAAKHGQLHVIEWLEARNTPLGLALCIAAAKGHVHILEWALRTGHKLNANIYYNAAANGQLHVIQWLKAANRPIHAVDTDMCVAAAYNGQLAMLQWCVFNEIPFSREECRRVARDPAVLAWLDTLPPTVVPGEPQ
jgi:hypothetical protein